MTHPVITKSRLFFWAISIGSLILCGIFESGYRMPLPLSLAISLLLIVLGATSFVPSSLPLLVFYFLLLYWLPFLHLVEYVYNPSVIYDEYICGLRGYEYARDIEIVSRVATIAAIGGGGLAAGLYASKRARDKNPLRGYGFIANPISLPSFIFIAAVAFFLSWLSAPSQTILQAEYSGILGRFNINFNAAGILSYVFIALLMIDLFVEKRQKIRNLKKIMIVLLLIIVVIWFQFMRGNRGCMGLIFAIAALSIRAGKGSAIKKSVKKKIILYLGIFLVVFIVGQYLGAMRTELANKHDFSDIFNADVSMFSGTWSAVLRTPFSVIGDFYYGLMNEKLGKTYWDMFLSLPPGFITKWLGIERPWEPDHCPAWEMTYGLGGTHAVVIPFMNFKSFGVFFVLLIYGFFIGKVELMARYPNRWRMLLYATFFIMGFNWFWYSEMSAIRGLMSFVVVWATYKVLPKDQYKDKLSMPVPRG